MSEIKADLDAIIELSNSLDNCSATKCGHKKISADSCGSSAVSDAIAAFDEWRRMSWVRATEGMGNAAKGASKAAEEYAKTDGNVKDAA